MSTVKQYFKKIIYVSGSLHFVPALFIGMFGVIIALSVFTLTARSIQAQDTGIPFGGLSVYIMYCTCTGPGVIAVTVNDLSTTPGSPPNYIFYPGTTTLHPYGMVYSTGVWLLGNRKSGGTCLYYAGKSCVTWPTSGTMIRVGTSAG